MRTLMKYRVNFLNTESVLNANGVLYVWGALLIIFAGIKEYYLIITK